MTVALDGNTLTLGQIARVLYNKEKVEITDVAWQKVRASRQVVEQMVDKGEVVYGITTGFGKFSDVIISKDAVTDLQRNLIRSHSVGVGDPFPEMVSRAMLLLRANALVKGYSGICQETLQLLLECLNHQVHPVIPSQGSLGASGDLAPLSHLTLVLMGEGEAIYRGKQMVGAEALTLVGLTPRSLGAKEGLALINGTQAMTAVGVIAFLEAKHLADTADCVAALTLEGLNGIVDAFFPEAHEVRAYPEQLETALLCGG